MKKRRKKAVKEEPRRRRRDEDEGKREGCGRERNKEDGRGKGVEDKESITRVTQTKRVKGKRMLNTRK